MPTDSDRRKIQTYLERPLDELEGELELYAPASRGVGDVWQKISGPLHQRLCVEWDYCTVRQDARLDDDLTLTLLVLDVLTKNALNLPFPIDPVLIAVLVVKRGLDVFCGCP